ncbi:MAG: arylformamidase [Alkalicoccus sp.]|nr:MAG: arylformamidase [Alkalicoccus sp.]
MYCIRNSLNREEIALWIDISRSLHEGMEVFPGDSEFQYSKELNMNKGSAVNTGTIKMNTHTGTHLDAPYHYDNNGRKINELDINEVCGKAEVIDLTGAEAVTEECIREKIPVRTDIILFRLKEKGTSFSTYPPFTAEAVKTLAERGVRVIGVDTPSVDPASSEELPAHHMCRNENMLILEGLNLEGIKEDMYELAAMPLNLFEADGSPVRAALRRWR